MNSYQLFLIFICLVGGLTGCITENDTPGTSLNQNYEISLDLEEARRLASLPMACIDQACPYKSGHVLADSQDLLLPIEHHPAFYGCFDWHSAVHGHWSLVYLLKEFPELDSSGLIRKKLAENLTAEKLSSELSYFTRNKFNKSFERTYGWAWLLKLQEELLSWDDADARQWASNMQDLAQYISRAYIDYLPKLVYPIRVGEHSNTAFGLSLAYDYAMATSDTSLSHSIENNARRFYLNDETCPLNWEPSGYDFLSPCLQELDIMRKVLSDEEFKSWSRAFLPDLQSRSLILEPAEVSDRTDGKLVHLDGLNFSRAWCLYSVDNAYLNELADKHMAFSLGNIIDGDYAGQHWLASFALYAYKCKKR